MADFHTRRLLPALIAVAALLAGAPAAAFESLDDDNLSGAVISQPDDAAFGAESETAGEEKPQRDPGAESDLIRAGRVQPPQHFHEDFVEMKILRG